MKPRVDIFENIRSLGEIDKFIVDEVDKVLQLTGGNVIRFADLVQAVDMAYMYNEQSIPYVRLDGMSFVAERIKYLIHVRIIANAVEFVDLDDERMIVFSGYGSKVLDNYETFLIDWREFQRILKLRENGELHKSILKNIFGLLLEKGTRNIKTPLNEISALGYWKRPFTLSDMVNFPFLLALEISQPGLEGLLDFVMKIFMQQGYVNKINEAYYLTREGYLVAYNLFK